MRRRWLVVVELLLVAGLVGWVAWSANHRGPRPQGAVDVAVQLRDAHDTAYLFQAQPDGPLLYRIVRDDGSTQDLSPSEFAQRVHQEKQSQSWLSALLNVSSPAGLAWVGLGLLAQVLFTGRMVVQWLASEKKKRSVVPPSFWWMSLFGSIMLLIYFLWRRDPVGLLGQAFGSSIYTRNLWLIYARPNGGPDLGEDPAPAAELGAAGEESAR